MYNPIVKWTGSKRSQANEIISFFPIEIETYYEPFCGSCAILKKLIDSENRVNKYVCSDINKDLIDLWNNIKYNPEKLFEDYFRYWNTMFSIKNISDKKAFYNEIRNEFNKSRDSGMFLFILRTTTNGMPRYNSKKEFNNTLHKNRDGIKPEKLKEILFDWSESLNKKDVSFNCCSYNEIWPNKNDFVYLDPPYYKTKGIYYGTINYDDFWEYLRKINCHYIFSFDGKTDFSDNTFPVPKDIYNTHVYINSGISSFRKLKGLGAINVKESLYIM